MQRSRIAYAVAGVALLAGTYSLPAAADDQNSYIHHRIVRRTHPPAGANDIIVRKRAYREPVAAAPDAFHGPAAIITAPVAIAGTIVSLRLVEAVFPPRANDPHVLIGAPVYVAGEIAEFPIVAVNSIFGVQPTNYF